ncbi:ATP-binding protein [Brumimicrobium glaciale]|uniref:ATP-binding protein n=1 Tax=Brumimicrobium glaciale TaxID=200475 RepID=A0A4Q4KJ41_9FLAO|nr:ATP-binding protein [Brumimicrobium glaciale]RYM32840.1 ATP-binding protein [Brumimicrobium glaciale]
MRKIIGRDNELKTLQRAIDSDSSELIAIYGRRRIGKTFLIREAYKKEIVFEVSGIPDGTYKQQISNFHNKILKSSKRFKKSKEPKDWLEAFSLLEEYISGIKSKKKKVIFIDELPWIHTPKSNFISLFAHFWNDYCTKRDDLVVVICGSAASFMINKVIKDKKGLHNRITYPIRLLPFNLHETELFLKSKKVNLSRYDYLQIYMAIGGIPHYLDKIISGDSVATAINRLCFKSGGILVDEFDIVLSSLFDNSSNHEKIVEALSKSKNGLTRAEIVANTSLSSGGTLTRTISELTESGFISEYKPFDKVLKETLYRLSDEYSLFYLKYIKNNSDDSWTALFNSRSYISWGGFAFEAICLKHTPQIKKALGIGGISSNSSSWKNKNAQIDLVIDRSDNCINLCEIKFSTSEYAISKQYKVSLLNKKSEFIKELTTRKNIFTTMITTFGVKNNQNSNNSIDNQIAMDCLFEKI